MIYVIWLAGLLEGPGNWGMRGEREAHHTYPGYGALLGHIVTGHNNSINPQSSLMLLPPLLLLVDSDQAPIQLYSPDPAHRRGEV